MLCFAFRIAITCAPLRRYTGMISGPDGVVATVTTNFDPITGVPSTQANANGLSGVDSLPRCC